MLGLSLDAVVEWRGAGHDSYVTVNVNAADLIDPRFAGDVARELIARDIPPTALVVEITERSILGDPEQAIATIDSLKGAGVSIALDDFGTGYSSLSHLVELPVDALKLDQRFVGAMTTSDAHAAIVESMIELSHRLGLKVVAEGIEDVATWDAIAEVGSDRAQGFLCAHPTPGAGMLGLLGELDDAARTGTEWHEATRRKAA
jgi:EAL domain-containing protein (putative c-di-GMP-specific phosphodiesterase class I)